MLDTPRRLIVFACLSLALSLLGAAPAAGLDTLYLVRHGEKAEGWLPGREADAFLPLSPAGERRAEALAARLGEAGIGAVYMSPTTRAIATAAPLIRARHLPWTLSEESIHAEQMGDFLAGVRQKHPGDRAVLIVGHSNTVPGLLLALGATADCLARLGIHEEEGMKLIEGFDGLWKVDLTKPGCEGMTRETYAAAPSPAS